MVAVIEALNRAWTKRYADIGRLTAEGTDAFRLVAGAADGLPGLVIDFYGPLAVLHVYEGTAQYDEATLQAAAEWLVRYCPVKSVYRKNFVVDRSKPNPRELRPFVGEDPGPYVIAHEYGLRFRVRPQEPFSVGLFLDQRAHRGMLPAQAVPDGNALNLFAYTCGFSVALAAAGRGTTSVDVSNRYLKWGQENFAENDIPPKEHRFFCEDARRAVKRLAKRGETFAYVVLDPPTFGRSADGVFRVERDLPKLAAEALELLVPGGLLFVSSNCDRWSEGDFRGALASVLEKKAAEEVLPPPLFDFPASSHGTGANPLRAALYRRR